MKATTKQVLMLCLVLSGAFCYANGVARTERGKDGGITIEVMQKVLHGGSDRSATINATIDGHYLTVTFTESLGQVAVTLTTASGAPVDGQSVLTPTGFMIYIPLAGDYIVTFTLPNGDEYYGEFTVTD